MTSFRLSRTFFESFWRFYRSAAVLSNFLLYHALERLSRSFSTFFIRSVAAYQRQLLDCNTLSCACQQLFEFLQASVDRAAHLADSLVRIPDLSLDSFALCIVLPLFQMPKNRFFSLLLYHLYWSWYQALFADTRNSDYRYRISQLFSRIGWSCSPLNAASTVSGILSKSAIREFGFNIALSCPKGTK